MIKKLKLSQEPVERRCNFGSYRFNRTLWNEWNLSQIEAAKSDNNNEELISGQLLRLEAADKDNKALQEKLNNAERINEKLRADNQQLRKDLSEAKKQSDSDKASTGISTEKDYKERMDTLRAYLKKTNAQAATLFPSCPEWSDALCVLRNDLLRRVYEKYKAQFNARKKTENPTRREDVLGMLYCLNKEEAESKDVLLYYPKSDQIYDNEYRNLILDALWDENDTFLNRIAKDAGYDKRWRETKKNNLLSEMDNYRLVKTVKAVLNQEGIVEASDNKHNKFSLGGDERYTYSIASTPSDHNAGKNAVDGFMEKFY